GEEVNRKCRRVHEHTTYATHSRCLRQAPEASGDHEPRRSVSHDATADDTRPSSYGCGPPVGRRATVLSCGDEASHGLVAAGIGRPDLTRVQVDDVVGPEHRTRAALAAAQPDLEPGGEGGEDEVEDDEDERHDDEAGDDVSVVRREGAARVEQLGE